MSVAEQALATLLDYVQRTHLWDEGGATRHDALLALGLLGADVPTPYRPQAALSLTSAATMAEREACANICDHEQGTAADAANKIRGRPNVKGERPNAES